MARPPSPRVVIDMYLGIIINTITSQIIALFDCNQTVKMARKPHINSKPQILFTLLTGH
jgi:hypothetical protein